MDTYEILKKNHEALRLLETVWDGRNEGTHGWMELDDALWLTLEPEYDGEHDFITATITDAVDFLGYPMGETFDVGFYNDDDIVMIAR